MFGAGAAKSLPVPNNFRKFSQMEKMMADSKSKDVSAVESASLLAVPGENPTYGEPDDLGFVGVSPEYANFANETDNPRPTPEEPVADEAQVAPTKTEK